MERNFMGLGSKVSVPVVKDEAVEGGGKDSGFTRIGVPSPLENKVSESGLFEAIHKSQWMNSKPSNAPSQLTIFYAGTVNVFNEISPEKAQAIMLLAGNTFAAHSKVHVQPPTCSGLPSPVSVSSHPIISSGLPLARKASLARFLEKRKERAMNATPYNLVKKEADSAADGIGFSATS